MTPKTDLYSIIISYANKNNSPYIKVDSFLEFLGQYAKNHIWVKDTAVKFSVELSALMEGGKCELLENTDEGWIYLTHYYPDLIRKAYQNAEGDTDIPFPSEESLRIKLPQTHIRPLGCGDDLFSYLDAPQDSDTPILRIDFPDGFGSALVLAGLIPRRLTEIAILKIWNYLRKDVNKEYVLRKLIIQLHSRSSSVRDQFNRILIKPLDCYNAIKEGEEFSGLFWGHFCAVLKNDIKKKNERLHEDIAVVQSAYIIETVSGYYKALAIKKRETELAFKSLDIRLSRPPFLYTMDQICKFANDKGILLLSIYSRENLEAWLRTKTTESNNNGLPALLIVRGEGKERFFVLKDKIPALCVRLFNMARIQVKDALTRHWRRLLLNYNTEPAMENNEEFEKILLAFTKKYCPTLTTLLDDPKLPLVYREAEQSESSASSQARIFSKGQLLPYSSLLFLQRKELLSDIKLMLPFWYSLPIITAIIAFFKNLLRNKKASKPLPADIEDPGEVVLKDKDRAGEIRAAAQDLELLLVPPKYTMDSYLEELESRWSRLIDKKARENLIEDVRTMIRDNLRGYLRIYKKFRLTQEAISQLAQNIILSSSALASLSGRDSLILYAELYLIKLLRNVR